MGKRLIFQPDLTTLQDHPAVRAWGEFGPAGPTPRSIEVLRVCGGKTTAKSSVYRLNGAGIAGTPVIAKRARRAGMLVERFLYQEVLPALPVSTLHYYGFLEEGDFCWLFLEDAGGVRYSESVVAHRALAAEWLGLMHAATGELDLAMRLPEHEPDGYLCCLRSARQIIGENLANPALDRDQVSALETIVGHCDALESLWGEVERLWDATPRCLVHGDFIAKNVRVRAEGTGAALYVMDWETAGWGVLAEDLGALDVAIAGVGGPDVAIYWSRVHDFWPDLDRKMAEKLVSLGTIFRYLAWIRATSPGLACGWAERAVQDLEIYGARLALARRAMGWT